MKKFEFNLTPARTIAISFICVIALGTIILMMPFSSRDGSFTPFVNALFIAVSSTCVTGLSVYDTFSHWSTVGQVVILILIQIGGLGFMTLMTMLSMFLHQKIGLGKRKILMQSEGNLTLSGIGSLIKRIVLGTVIFEVLGAVLLATQFIPATGSVGRGIYFSVFHSVSAFCNAGFDLMGYFEPSSSLTLFGNNVVVNLTIMMLIITGGIGFIVWSDIAKFGIHLKKYSLHSKIVLSATCILVFGGAGLFLLFEYNHAFADMTLAQKVMYAFFQSVTTRTAGFNTFDLTTLSESGNILTNLLMFIGGSPGSTAGGIKTTTFALLLLACVASSKNDRSVRVFRYRIEENTVREASSIAFIYLMMAIISCLIICAIEPFGIKEIMFEVISAIGTVGLTLGITPLLTTASKLILALLMFAGRIGGLTFILTLSEREKQIPIERPVGKILIG